MLDQLQRMVLIKLIKTGLGISKFYLITIYFEIDEMLMVMEIKENEDGRGFKRVKKKITEKDLDDFERQFSADPRNTRAYIEQKKITLETIIGNEHKRFEV